MTDPRDRPPTLAALLSGTRHLGPLLQAQRNREALLLKLETDPFLAGMDEFLELLQRHATLMDSDDTLSKLSPLVARIQSEFLAAIECLFSGMHCLVGDLMRTVMEAEYLFAEFVAEPHRIADWLNTPLGERWKQFGPAQLRKRKGDRLGIAKCDLHDHKEYGIHSEGIHFGEAAPWYADRGISTSQSNPALTICIGEILEHGRRFLLVLNDLCQSLDRVPTRETIRDELVSFLAKWEHIQLTLEVWRELDGRTESKALDDIFPRGDGPLDMLRLVRYGYAKMIAQDIRSRSGEWLNESTDGT